MDKSVLETIIEDKNKLDKLHNWTHTAETNRERLSRIYKDLCEYEDLLNEQESEENTHKILELLEMVNDLRATAAKLRPTCDALNTNTTNIRDQMLVLDKAFNVLQLQKKHNDAENL